MPQNHELPKEIEQVLLLEKTQGYFNCATVGGFAGWLQTLAERLPQTEKERLLQLAESYDQAAFLERPLLWQEIWQLLVDIPALIWQPQTAKSSLPLEVQEAEQAIHTSIQYLKGVGPKKAALLRRLGIYSIRDLLFWLPRTYEVRGEVVPIAEAEPGQMVAIRGKILTNTLIPTSKRLTILKVLLADKTGSINVVWFNQKHLQKQLTAGKYLMVYGKLERKFRQTELWVQDYELLETGLEQSAKILPVYPSTGNLSQKNIRALLAAAWERYSRFLTESLPPAVLAKRQLLSLREALSEIHFPSSLTAAEAGRVRLAYEELLILQLAVLQNRVPETAIGIARPSSEKDLPTFLAELSFPLTNAQRRVIGEVFHDMEREKPMARLVQGDVGSGKTIVAAAALYKNAVAGYQGALMAPTEILAQQHYQTLQPIFTKLGYKIALLTGDTGSKERRELLQQIKFGEIAVVIGTHTLFQKDMEFANLALAITDEQHRFGVMQRTAFQEKGKYADMLIMTATPIPRTLSMTLYGDLDVSVIDELPPGRQTIATYAVGYDKEQRAMNFVLKELQKGRQAYVVCPLVEESDKMDLESATTVAEQLQHGVFAAYRVGLLHGKMKAKEKEDLMQQFVHGDIQVLVATTVIEVGINVPNATMMVIRDAERFGLAQLHQLRGRVGRGAEQSYCILLHHAKSQVARERMKTMVSTTDGFVIAEADLKLRGAGEIFGTRQHGMAELRYAQLAKDEMLLSQARTDAIELMKKPMEDASLLSQAVAAKVKLLNS